MELSLDVISVLEADGTVRYNTPSLTQLLGWSPEELEGCSSLDLLHPEDRDRVANLFAEGVRRRDATVRTEYRCRHKDQTYRTLDSQARNLLHIPEVNAIVVVSRDITEKEALAEQLRRTEERFRLLVEEAQEIVLVCSPASEIRYVSPAVTALLGWSVEEFSSRRLLDWVHEDDRPRLLEVKERGDAHPEKRARATARLPHRNGTWRWLEGLGQDLSDKSAVGGILLHLRDVTDRVEAERGLALAERRYRALAQHGNDIVTLLDSEGRILFESPALERLTGWTPEEVEGCSAFDLIHEEDRAAVIERFGAVLAAPGATSDAEFRFRVKSGGWCCLEALAVNQLHDESVRAVVVNSRDVTQRKLAEEARAEAAAALKDLEAIIHRSPAIAFLCRAEGRWPVEYVSRNIESIGYSAEDLESGRLNFVDLIHPDDMERVVAEVERWTTSGEPEFNMEYRFRTADGRDRWINDTTWVQRQVDGKATHYQCLVFDIHDRKLAEAKVEETAENRRRLIDASPLPIVSLDLEGRVTQWNPAAELAFGWRAEELIGKLYPLVPREEAASFVDGYLKALEGPATDGQETYRYRRDGSVAEVRVFRAPILGPDGAPSGVLGILEDVTESQMAQRFQALRAEANQAILDQSPVEELLQRICREIGEITGLPLVWLAFSCGGGGLMLGPAYAAERSQLDDLEADARGNKRNLGSALRALASGQEQHERRATGPESDSETNSWVEVAAFPLLPGTARSGALVVQGSPDRTMSCFMQQELRLIAGQIELMLQTAQEQEQLRLQSVALDAAANAIFITDSEGRITWVNHAFTELSGYAQEEVLGSSPSILRSGVHPAGYYEQFWETIKSGRPFRSEVTDRHKNGGHYVVAQTVTPLVNQSGEVTHYIAIHEDVTARREAEARVRYLAHHDPLTGLPNRVLFRERLELALQRACAEDELVMLLFLDLDHFKTVNDTLGHDAGDELLQEVARRCSGCIRSGDTLARLGGDEFTIILTDAASPEAGARVAEKLIEVLSAPIVIRGRSLYVTPSIGISAAPVDADSADELLRAADTAMYRAKQRGRNRYQYFTQSLNAEVERRFMLENGLRSALDEGRFELFYQPEIDLKTGKVFALEALLRWRHPEKGIISPSEFIPVAEEVGLIGPIGDWVLREACRQGANWQRKGLPSVTISVNVSFKQARHRDLAADFRAIVESTGFDPHYLALELTEDALMENPIETRRWIQELRKLGIQFWIDDFGTGYSSLASLGQLPLDALKIDRSFTAALGSDERAENLVTTIITMAHGMRLQVVAEGVETDAQRNQLSRWGCDFGQGFLWSKPAAAPEIEALINSHLGSG